MSVTHRAQQKVSKRTIVESLIAHMAEVKQLAVDAIDDAQKRSSEAAALAATLKAEQQDLRKALSGGYQKLESDAKVAALAERLVGFRLAKLEALEADRTYSLWLRLRWLLTGR